MPLARIIIFMKIRIAKRPDAKPILRLMRQLIELHARIDRRYKPFGEYRGLRAYVQDAMKSKMKRVLIAEEASEIVGYLFVEIETMPFYFRGRRIGKISDTAVDRAYRRRGILRLLTRQALNWLKKRGVRETELNVDSRNSGAVAAWEALGFKVYKLRMRRVLKD